MCRYSCIFSEFILREISNGLSFYVLERENRKAPNQHRCFSGWLEELGNTAPPPLPVRRFHIHSKTACRGVSERQWRSAANRSRLPLRSVLGAPHRGAAPEPAGETKSFCPCQKSQVSLVRYLTFSLVCGRIWQRGAPAGLPAVRVVGRVRAGGTQATAPVSAPASVGAGRSPPGSSTRGGRRDQVLLPLPQNRRKHWVFAGFLFTCVAWFWCSLWFKVRLFAPGLIRSHPPPTPPAPKTHPVLPFSAQTGCVFLFFAVFWLQNFRAGFCASCRITFIN